MNATLDNTATTCRPADQAAFTSILAGWHEKPRCEIRTQTGEQCSRPAKYHATCHTCGRGLICVDHLQKFMQQLGITEQAQCNRCGRTFASIDQAITLVEL
ncbi:hypothetical protein [Mycobacterium sp. 141]|uniref:hypothetical protein n=1 Tax=Mycobacterium sp. 141 TaxID=1120797 RepID=UPI0003AA0ABD|nr:hypothetical protein [Mycobacterium sp. 141]